MTPILEAHNLRMTFSDSSPRRHARAGRHVARVWSEGEFLAVVGPSGCGKSTLLRLLAGLLQPIVGPSCVPRAAAYRAAREIGFVFQRANLMPWRTVHANIVLPLEIDEPRSARRTRGLRRSSRSSGWTASPAPTPSQLSGGMQQRVALARALIHEPSRAAARRAVRFARRAHPRTHECGAAAHLESAAADGRDGDAQHQRGGVPGRPRRRYVPAARPRPLRVPDSAPTASATLP